MSVPVQQPSIPEFFEGKSVFVTGGMGFLGKVLIEKLLRSCPGVENIYMLCRSKKGKNVNERLEEITESPVFDELREKNPQAFNKIILIEGDVAKLELGISKEDQDLLKEKVSIVMHSAATINFNEPLKIAVNTNLRAMRELLALSRQMKNLKSFVHISTAYTNWFELDVKETVGPTNYDPNGIIKLCDTSDDTALEMITPSLLGKHTNTYTFTKNLAEKLIQNEASDLPIAIVRPALVGASMTEPKPGWNDSWATTTPFLYAISIGAFRSVQHINGHPMELIPVDLVINMTIAASWNVAMEKISNSGTSFPLIYHSSSGDRNPVTLETVLKSARDYGRSQPYNKMIWYPKMRMYESKILNKIDQFVFHSVPAYISDFAAKISGNKQIAVKYQKNIEKNYEATKFAVTNPYIFQLKNSSNILAAMTHTDKKLFNFDPKTINWSKYLNDYNDGIKKFLVKEKPMNPEIKMAQLNRFKYASYLINGTLALASLYIITKTGRLVFKSVDSKEEKRTKSPQQRSSNLLNSFELSPS